MKMTEQVKFYQNNPCVIIRDINEDFAEVSISHHYAGDMELTGQCEGCCVGDSDNKLSCSCDDHSWIIEAVQEEENKLIVVVEKRLLTDNPVEHLALLALNKLTLEARKKLEKTKELHEEWRLSLNSQKAAAKALQVEVDALKLSRSAYDNLRNQSEQGLCNLTDRHNKMLVEISCGIKPISMMEYRALLESQKKLRALEKGGVDNWEWYSESLKNANLS